MKASHLPPSSTLLLALALAIATTTYAFVPPMTISTTTTPTTTASNRFHRPSLSTSTTTSSSFTTSSTLSTTTLFYSIQRRHNNIDDLESARAAFEKLMQAESASGMPADLGILAPPEALIGHMHSPYHVLTSAGKHRRLLEMDLLSSLEESDDAIEELIHLWTTERDGEAATDLLAMQEECSEGLVLEELRLRELSQEYPGWAEPFARLATLLYYKGRTREAYHMAEQALELKPWHFEATQLLILLSLREENHAMALKWARMSLPKLRPGASPKNIQRRKAWVQRALELAAEQLQQAEHVTEQMQRRAALEFLQEQPEYIWQ